MILLVIRLLGAPGARTAAQSANKILATPRILLVRPDHLGDLLMTTPVFHALKQQAPNARISVMVGPWSSEVVARHPDIDRILTCPFPGFQRAAQKALAPYILLFNTAKQLRRGHFDVAINLRPDFWWGAALLAASQFRVVGCITHCAVIRPVCRKKGFSKMIVHGSPTCPYNT